MRAPRAWCRADASDAEIFCKDVEPGEGRVKNCLKANKDKLKPACRKKVDRWK